MSSNDEYRAARDAQNSRYESVTGLPHQDTDRQEYRDYFGTGDHAGTPVEKRVTLKDWLVNGAREADPSLPADVAFFLSGADLAKLAADGDYGAELEIVRRAVKRASKRVAA